MSVQGINSIVVIIKDIYIAHFRHTPNALIGSLREPTASEKRNLLNSWKNVKLELLAVF